jgi:hypothetical protein
VESMRVRRRLLALAMAVVTANSVVLSTAPAVNAAPSTPDDGLKRSLNQAPSAWDDATARVADKVAAIDRIRRLAERSPDSFAGVSTNGPDDVTINLILDASAAAELAAMERDAAANGIALKRKYRKHSLRELMRVEKEISNEILSTGPGSGFSSVGINPDTNAVEVGTAGPSRTALAKLRSTHGDKVSVVPAEPVRLTFGRFNDADPFYAGNRIRVDGERFCTSAFTITNLYGDDYTLTAGHCTSVLGRTVRVLRADGETAYNTIGTVDFRRFGGGNFDNALIGTNHYGPRMWSSPGLEDNNTVFLPVHSALDSCDGCVVIFNGSVSGITPVRLSGAPLCRDIAGVNVCGLQRVFSVNGSPACQGGDSGGPVFAHNGRGGAIAVGIITAGFEGGTSCYYTRLPPILTYWRSTITTG